MRKFLSTTAGATFNEQTPNLTFAVRKTCIELIFKIDRGVYAIINMSHGTIDKVLLTANWNRFFQRVKNPDAQIPRVKKACPTLYKVWAVEDEDGIRQASVLDWTGNKEFDAFCLLVDVPERIALIDCLSPKVRITAGTLLNKCLDIYNELHHNPPFPAWKQGLDELWN